MNKIYAILVISLLFQFNANAQWEKQTAPDFILTDDFNSVARVNNDIFCAVGQNGRIIRSTDNGTNWISVESQTNEDLYSVFFIDNNTGWSVGNNGVLVRTVDGEYWELIHTGINSDLRDVFFVNAYIGWTCGADGVIYKTTNGGSSWTSHTSGSSYTLHSIYFIDSNNGWICGNVGEILRTTNGGTTWDKQNSNTTYSLSSVYFIDSNIGWICGILNSGQYGKILKTTDGGVHWNNQFDTQTNESLYSIKFFDSNNGISVGIKGTIYRTTNGGTNWIKKNSSTTNSLRSISFNDLNNEIAVGLSGTVLRSTNSGDNWESIVLSQVYNLNSVCFTDKNNGWAAGSNGVIIHTSDGGIHWETQQSNYSQHINQIFFIDSLKGWCVSNNSIMIRTSDGGIEWNKIDILENSNISYPGRQLIINSMSFIDSLNGWIAINRSEDGGYSGITLKTSDGGKNWKIFTNFISTLLNDIEFFTENYGWILAEPGGCADCWGGLWNTTDGGMSFGGGIPYNYFGICPPPYYYSMDFISFKYGFVIGRTECEPFIYQTKNAGSSWINKTPIFNDMYIDEDYFYHIEFVDENTGWVLGRHPKESGYINYIAETDDAGNTWTLIDSIGISDLSFINRQNGWAVGGKTILKYIFNSTVDENNWSNNISIESNTESKTITFGQSPSATDGIDTNLGEEELPPPPPAGVLDFRFNLPSSSSSIKDYRNSSNTDIIWTLKFQPDTSGYPLTFVWNRYSFPDGSFRLRDIITGNIINLDMKEIGSFELSNSGISSLIIEYTKNTCANISINRGWNLMSIPFSQPNMSVDSLFPSAISSAFIFDDYSFSSTYNQYKSVPSLQMGKGFWIKFVDSNNLNFCGLPYFSNIYLNSAGWHIIGPFEKDIPVNQILSHPSNLLNSNFFSYDNSYKIAYTLNKGKGYWIKTSQNGGAIEFVADLKNINKKEKIVLSKPSVEIPIRISDEVEGIDTLIVGIDSIATDSIDTYLGEAIMPPLPPIGAFDARLNIPNTQESSLSDIRFGPEADQFERVYQVQYQKGEGEQIVLSWNLQDGLKLRVQDIVTGSVIDQTFEPGIDSIVVTNPDAIDKLKLTITFPSHYTPVELTSLEGKIVYDAVELNWKTATETNNKGFEVQRKLNSNWERIGYVSGHGTSTNPNEYNFTNDFKYESFKGIVSYRLKQIDLDGSYHYSEEVKLDIDFTPKEFTLYQNYPNPFNPSTTIKYALPFESSVDITIYNMIGQRISEFTEGIKGAGYHNVVWQPKDLSSGIYFYTINAKSTDGKNNYSKTLKMLFMK